MYDLILILGGRRGNALYGLNGMKASPAIASGAILRELLVTNFHVGGWDGKGIYR